MSHLDELKEQLEEAVAAQDFDSAARLRSEIDGIAHSAKVRGVDDDRRAAYFVQRQAGEGLKPSGPAR